MMLGGRQSGETFRSTLPEPILNVDMLIVTFKFLLMVFRKVYSLFMVILPLA